MTDSNATLNVSTRVPSGSRSARRMRRDGRVPGVVYGGEAEPLSFDVDARELRHALAHSGALIDLSVDGAATTPVMVKDAQRHPVRGETVHIDLLRVRLDVAVHAVVTLELTGEEDAPGVRGGGVLEHVTRELNVEALPGAIPESISYDVSGLDSGESVTTAAISMPAGVTLLDDPETVIATILTTRLQIEADQEIETETEVVGDAAAGDADGSSGD